MSVQRYFADDGGYGCNLIKAPDGCYVLHADYAALEARCAGLERENDTLRSRADTNRTVVMQMDKTMEVLEAERDALQAKLAAAEARADALMDSQYIAGAKAGWNAAQSDNPEEAYARITRYDGHIKVLQEADAILAGHKASPQKETNND